MIPLQVLIKMLTVSVPTERVLLQANQPAVFSTSIDVYGVE